MVRKWKKSKWEGWRSGRGKRVRRASVSLQASEAQDSCAPVTAVPCVWLHVITATPHPHHHHSLLLQVCLPFTVFLVLVPPWPCFNFPPLSAYSSPQFLPFLFCYSRPGSRILIWCYASLLIFAFSIPPFPADGTYFRTSCSLRPLPLVVSSVCVSFRPVQAKPQPFYHGHILRSAPLTPLFFSTFTAA